MNLSKETVTLIKNFANINGSLLLQPGNRISTISEGRNIMGEAEVQENFPIEFGIYDLDEFLSAISIFSNSEIEFSQQYATISDNAARIKYYASGAGIVKAPPATIKFPDPDIEFVLDASQLAMIIKTASVLKTTDLSIVAEDGTLSIRVKDKKNATANGYDVTIGKCDKTFTANFKVTSLKSLLPGSYDVAISSKKISRFVNQAIQLRYFIAVEADSVFE